MRKKVKIFDIVLGIIMLVITFIAVYPLYYIYINSVSGGAYVVANEVIWYPKVFTTYAYSLVFQNSTIVRAFFNSVFYTVAGTLLSVTLTALCAYPLSRKDFYGKKVFTAFILFTMFFSGGIIPLFLTITCLLYTSEPGACWRSGCKRPLHPCREGR